MNRERAVRDIRTQFNIIRSENTPDDLIIEGYFALYEQETELFQDCFEIISRGAFKNIVDKDIRALWNHNTQYVLGRTTNGTLELIEDDKGLFGRVKLPNTTYAKDLYEIIKRGDLDQCSFGFEIVDEELEELANNKYRWRINDINLFEVRNAEYIRLRRAHILNSLKTEKDIKAIQKYLLMYGLEEPEETIKDEIKNLGNIGIAIVEANNKYRVTDKIIELEIPIISNAIQKDSITNLKDMIRSKLHSINHDYLVLVDLAYSDADTKSKKNMDAKEFEIQTAKLFTEELRFKGDRLGDSNKPDVIISYDNFGTIVDAKSYKDGFNLDSHCKDEMIRYIDENNQRIPGVPKNEWWKNFESNVVNFTFLFVTSFLKGNFKLNLEYIAQTKGINGATISVESLLYLAEKLKSGNMSYLNFYSLFKNDEIVVEV